MANHSSIVGGSTAKRVMACPGSVALVNKMPPRASSVYADTGTLLHTTISEVLEKETDPASYIGTTYAEIEFDEDLLNDKLLPALAAFNEIDPKGEMEFACEVEVGFGKLLPGVFGSADVIARIGNRGILLDWKFGDGVAVEVEENPQLMFYVAAAMRTEAAKWAFDGVDEIECVIVQPPSVKRWVTTPARIAKFEKELMRAVRLAKKYDAPLKYGDHCRWCAAKPICPIMTGAVGRALAVKVNELEGDLPTIGNYLKNADMLEEWIKDLRALGHTLLENGKQVPGWKLVPKRATRQWVNEDVADTVLRKLGLTEDELTVMKMVSPAQAEKALKKIKQVLPADLVVAVSSGNTMAPESDPRPAVVQIGQQLKAALSKLS